MWLDNKKLNFILKVILFFFGMNIFHVGQLLIPIACLVVFISNKYVFKVKNIKTFILLCIFSLSFMFFSRKMGAYCVVGIFLPMAYYIGSNINESNDNVKEIIYTIALGMATHVLLNFVYDLSLFGLETFSKKSHYDIWLKEVIPATTTTSNCVFIISCVYYALLYENNKKNKILLLLFLLLNMLYNFGLGRRTPVLMLLISFFSSFVFDLLFSIKTEKQNRNIKIFILTTCICLSVFVLLYFFDIFNIKAIISKSKLYAKFFNEGLNAGRLEIINNAIKLIPEYIWGGQQISNSLNIAVHDLWIDTYDLGGIIPCAMIVYYSLYMLFHGIKKIIINRDKKICVLFFTFIVCVSLEMIIEPVMSSLTILLISVVIVSSSYE